MKNYSEDASRQYHIQVAKGEVGRYAVSYTHLTLPTN